MFARITSGTTVGVISPAWIPDKERLENGIQYLRTRDLHIKLGQNMDKQYGYFAGSDDQRISDIHDMYKNKEVKAIFSSRLVCQRASLKAASTASAPELPKYTLLAERPGASAASFSARRIWGV